MLSILRECPTTARDAALASQQFGILITGDETLSIDDGACITGADLSVARVWARIPFRLSRLIWLCCRQAKCSGQTTRALLQHNIRPHRGRLQTSLTDNAFTKIMLDT